MSFFQEQLNRDIEQAFLNLDEFAEEVEIDGIMRPCVLDDGLSGFVAGSGDGLRNAAGVGLVSCERVLYAKDDFEWRPVPDQVLRIDGQPWQVVDVKIQMGLLVVELNRVWS